MALCYIHRFACFHIASVELIHPGTFLTNSTPSLWDNVFHLTVDYHKLCVRVSGSVIAFCTSVVGFLSVGGGKGTFYKDITMISRSVSYPGEWASVVAEVTAVGKQTATSQDGVTTSVQFTRLHIDCSVCLQCISGTDDMYTVEGNTFTVQQQTFSLSMQVGSYGQVFQ